MRTIEILNAVATDELENDIRNRFGLEMEECTTYTCENDEAEELEKYLKANHAGIRLNISENSDRYIGALVNWNADPFIVENDEQALTVMKYVRDYGIYEISKEEDPEEFAERMAVLDLTEKNNPKHIYGDGDITFCLAEDWELAD